MVMGKTQKVHSIIVQISADNLPDYPFKA